MVQNQHCTAHFISPFADIHTGPKRHLDRFGLKHLLLSSFKYRFVKGKMNSSKHYIVIYIYISATQSQDSFDEHSIVHNLFFLMFVLMPRCLTFLSSISPWCVQDFSSPSAIPVQILLRKNNIIPPNYPVILSWCHYMELFYLLYLNGFIRVLLP